MTTSVTHALSRFISTFFNRLRPDINASSHTMDRYRSTMRLFLE